MSVDDAKKQAEEAAEARRLGIQPYELAMARAVPTDLVQAIVNDNRRGPSQPSSPGRPRPPTNDVVQVGHGWVEPAPLTSPPGQDHIERIANSLAPHGPAHPSRRRNDASQTDDPEDRA
jgi:hypothetical protein